MGTRSITIMQDLSEKGEIDEIAVLYRQYDGYPSGHGAELAQFLAPFKVVNGFGEETDNVANGADCLAAQIVAHFKDGVGQFYLMKAGTRNVGDEYRYYVYPKDGKVYLRVFETNWNGVEQPDSETLLWEGFAEDYKPE